MARKYPKLPPVEEVEPGFRFPGTALVATTRTYIVEGKRHIRCLCICGSEKEFYYHNIGKCTKSCSGCHAMTSAHLAIRKAAHALRGKVAPKRIRKPRGECTPEEYAAHEAYLEMAGRKLEDVETEARALVGTVEPQRFDGAILCATPEQLASHWGYLSKAREDFVTPTTVEAGKVYGLWLALESCEAPRSRTKLRCRCALCNQTERDVSFRILSQPANGGCRCSRPPITRPSEVRVGDKYDHWEVLDIIKQAGRKLAAVVKCDCGKTEPRTIQVQGLLNGFSKSCGCHNLETRRNRLEPGFRHGQLEVVRWLRQSSRQNGRPSDSVYLCRCDCGGAVEVLQRHLNPGPDSKQAGTTSCGCVASEKASRLGARMVSGGMIANARWHYQGAHGERLMRSSWELAFAIKLDEMGLEWIYEPKTFKLKHGLRYTPDFYVPSKKTWYEIKAIVRDRHFFEKVSLFRSLPERLVILWGREISRFIGEPEHKIHEKYGTFEIKDKHTVREIRTRIKLARE